VTSGIGVGVVVTFAADHDHPKAVKVNGDIRVSGGDAAAAVRPPIPEGLVGRGIASWGGMVGHFLSPRLMSLKMQVRRSFGFVQGTGW
jgi:hypothetical protein